MAGFERPILHGLCSFGIATKIITSAFAGNDPNKVKAIKTVRVQWQGGQLVEVAGSEKIEPADLVLLAMGFVSPVGSVIDAFKVEKDSRGNAKASTDGAGSYSAGVPKVFAAGDMFDRLGLW